MCCKSQKRGKQVCNRKFRRQQRQKMRVGDYQSLPLRTFEVMSPWDLGGDGKGYFYPRPKEKWSSRPAKRKRGIEVDFDSSFYDLTKRGQNVK